MIALLRREREQIRELGLRRHHYQLLFLIGAAAFFDGYDTAVKSVALKQIRETFDLTKSGGSAVLAIVTLGALPALALTRLADRIGRRSVLLWTVLGYTAFSGFTALSRNWAEFAGLQVMANVFVVAESAIVWTYAAEELPAKARGFGFGIIGMLIALGTGLAPLIYGPVTEQLGWSWRWMYVFAVPPLLLVSAFRRRLPESRRFEAARETGHLAGHWRAILAPEHRRWLMLIVATAFLFALTYQAGIVAIDFLESERGFSATLAGNMMVLAGLPGIPIMVMAGAWSDRFGRRLVGCSFAAMTLGGGAGFFWLPTSMPKLAVLPCMSMMLIGTMGSFPVLQTFVTELFPTGLRSSATSWSSTTAILGRTASLGIAAVLLQAWSQPVTITLLSIGPISAILIVAKLFPDTHGRELEETSGEITAPAAVTALGDGEGEREEAEEPVPLPLL